MATNDDNRNGDDDPMQALHRLLLDDADRRRRAEADLAARLPDLKEAERAVESALRSFGVLPPPNDDDAPPAWRRTAAPSSLLSVPSVPPLTTLAPLSAVPLSARGGLKLPVVGRGGSGEDAVVEVPLQALVPPDDGGGADGGGGGGGGSGEGSSSLARRPLAGNLSTKLTEFTRGRVGERRPFKAGGMDVNDLAVPEDAEATDALLPAGGAGGAADAAKEDYCSEEQVRAAREVLSKGALAAWRDGTLLTAPPGVSYEIGMGMEDLYENADRIGPKGSAAAAAAPMDDEVDQEPGEADIHYGEEGGSDPNGGGGSPNGSNEEEALRIPTSKMWDRSYFDDDSLFGDSTSGSSSGDESDGESSSGDEDDDASAASDGSAAQGGSSDGAAAAAAAVEDKLGAMAIDDTSADADDVDALLAEMKLSTQSAVDKALAAKKKKKSGSSSADNANAAPSNPLLPPAVDPSAPRKSWAVTDPLPIRDFRALVPDPAIAYPFELDDFQKQAVARLERAECIFVAAHTSAGKTVCAEYAIALARRHCTRAIYTSPIKALSNQKYRDFRDKFGDDVGLITGDLQIGADSSCLIMTTEILRSMLYRGADLIRDIEWVIFDEVHYINDSERGVVWEEVIIMLPDYVNLIFLSATTPNTVEFSDWIGRTKRKPVHVIRTDYRPVPLSHHLYAGQKLHKVMEGKSGFLEKGYKDATKALLPQSVKDQAAAAGKKGAGAKGPAAGAKPAAAQRQVKKGGRDSSWQQQGNRQNWTSLVKFLDREGLVPTVVFSFSKKKCEEIANMLRTLDLNTAAERNTAHSFAIQTMARLSPTDASLPQVTVTCEMVKRGIGVHHGGLLPILKEMVEILFSRGLVKVLFATETFAMGVNMPAKAVVFNTIRKHDGTQFRVLEPGEYTQMAGRAGRRGLDKVGTVILCCFGDEPPPQHTLRNMLTGSGVKLSSQFRLTYNMILNLLRVEDMSVEGMIKRSFSEFATQRALSTNEYPKLLSRGLKTLAKLDEQFKQEADSRIGAEDIEDYFSTCAKLLSISSDLLNYIVRSAGGTGGGSLVSGRVILVTSARKHGYVRAPALILQPPVTSTAASQQAGVSGGTSGTGTSSKDKPLVCLVLLPESYVHPNEENVVKPGHLNYIGASQHRHYAIHEVGVENIVFVSAVKHRVDSKSLYQENLSLSTARGAAPSKDPFARAMPMGRRPGGDDPFAGFVPRAKKGHSVKASSESSQTQLADQVTSDLILTEALERKSSLDIMDMRDCVKGVSQGSESLEFRAECGRMESLVADMRRFQAHYHPSLERHYATVERKETLRATVKTLRHLLSNESLQLFPDFLQRKALLQTLGYVDENDTVCVKGRVACEVNTCEELIVTEMVFEGLLNELEPAEIVAALSSLIFQEKSNDDGIDSELPERLAECCTQLIAIATKLGVMQRDHGLSIDPQEYCDGSLKFGLVHVVYEWALGVPFSNICELTLVQEGSIVRCITRLDELCREVRNCARVVGNPTLYRKMEAASTAIKRDIVFASSLYVT